jgi:signal transduction histidine kinase/CheY-like chemotaxis protein
MAPPTKERSKREHHTAPASEIGEDLHRSPYPSADASQDGTASLRLATMKGFFRVGMLQPAGMELPFEELRKRKLFAALVAPGTIIMLGFGLYHLVHGNILEGWLDAIGGLWLLSSILWLRIAHKGVPIYRINTILLGLLFLYLAAKGGIEGNKILWLFSYPLVALYTLGIPEGLVWSVAEFALCLVVLFWPVDVPWVHTYALDFKIRFCAAYAFVVSIACIYEYDRQISQAGLENERQNLKSEKRERKELEAKLVRSQKMEALGLLAGGVAHDLNNVLSGIVSYPDMMLMRLPGDSDLRRPLSVMRDSGQKAAAIVQDLLTLARRGVTKFEVLDINALIDEYLQSPEFEKLKSYHPKVEVQVDLGADLFNIRGSAIHLKKSLMNLVSNAAEASADGGLVRIATENRAIDRRLEGYIDVAEGEYVVLSVSDDGSGIDREDLGRIFEPFYTKKKMGRSGTGLGLAVVWGTVEDHHGYINVSSKIGSGTLIEIFLPVTRERLEQKDRIIPPGEYAGNGEWILVVDDMPAQREITTEMLTVLGYRATAVASGEEAVAFVQENPVDLVVLDMIMEPGIDGLETYSRLQAIRPGLKVLLVSGFSETGRVKSAQLLGAGAYVKKPFGIESIGMAVRNELDRKA